MATVLKVLLFISCAVLVFGKTLEVEDAVKGVAATRSSDMSENGCVINCFDGTCCPWEYPICSGGVDGGCCPRDRPIWSNGNCY